MDLNLALDIGFKGQLKLNAQAVPMQEGYLKIGGIIDSTLTAPVPFGVVVSADPATPNVLKAGAAAGRIVRGIAVFDDAIAQNSPAHPNGYLPGLPAAALSYGMCWIGDWKKTATGAIDPVIGAKVIYSTTTGTIEFLAASGSAPAGWAVLDARIKDVDNTLGALVFLN